MEEDGPWGSRSRMMVIVTKRQVFRMVGEGKELPFENITMALHVESFICKNLDPLPFPPFRVPSLSVLKESF